MADTLKAGSSLSTGDSLTSANGAYTVTLQEDGNLVLSEGGNAVWATGTNGSGANKASVQEDGNFVLYAGDKPVWASDTAGKSGVWLVLQDDRNLVLYEEGNNGVWSSRTVTDTPPAPAPEPEPEPAPVQTITEAAAPPPPPPAPRTYTVVSGDTLWAIAEQYLGDGNRYTEIAQLNGIANPDLINVGQVITIP